jgi:CheY-like chemotaxis protein
MSLDADRFEKLTIDDEALALLERETKFDLIFCDLMMPETSGIDVFQSVDETAPELARRFIFMTGGAFTELADRFLAEVSNPCIQKPFHSDQLNGLVRERLAKLDAKRYADLQHDSKLNEGEQR